MDKEIKAVIIDEENINGVIQLEPLRGPQGLSSYEIYVNNHSDGEPLLTEIEWLNSLNKANYYKQYKQTYVTESDKTAVIPILISVYNSTCLLDVYLNGLRLDDTEYSVDNNIKKITFIKPINKDQTVHIIVTKTIVATSKDYALLKGEGLPDGGSAGQVLVKKSNTDYDFEWGNSSGGSGVVIKRWEGVE